MTQLSGLLFAAALAGPLLGGASQQPTAEDLLREGKRLLVEVNCSDCYTRSESGLREGIRKLEEALRLGLKERERGEACWLLADGYNAVALFYERTPEGGPGPSAMAKRGDALACAVEADPLNPEWLYEYAFTVAEDVERERAFRRILEIDPDHAGAMFAIGGYEVRRGIIERGADKMLRAFWLAEGWEAIRIGEALLEDSKKLGLESEREAIESRLDALRKDAL